MSFDPNATTGIVTDPVNLLVPGATKVFTIPPGCWFIPLGVGVCSLKTVTGVGLGAFTVSAGTNGTAYNNLYAALTPAVLNIVQGKVLNVASNGNSIYGGAIGGQGTDVYLNVQGLNLGFTALSACFYFSYYLSTAS